MNTILPTSDIPSYLYETYGVQIYQPSRWSVSDLVDLFDGFNLIKKAFTALNLPDFALHTFFDGTELRLVRKYTPIYYILTWGGSSAIVPPVGILGWRGATIHFLSNISISMLIHELGHRLDFKLGSTYQHKTLTDLAHPSTQLMHATGSSYINSPQTCERHRCLWGYCVATRGWQFIQNPRFNPVQNSGYQAGLSTSAYGRTDHFEDFAESWLAWVLNRSQSGKNKTVHEKRLLFFDKNLPLWLKSVVDTDIS